MLPVSDSDCAGAGARRWTSVLAQSQAVHKCEVERPGVVAFKRSRNHAASANGVADETKFMFPFHAFHAGFLGPIADCQSLSRSVPVVGEVIATPEAVSMAVGLASEVQYHALAL